MNSHDRWVEKCDRCNLPAKGTGSQWIDGTRICSFCRMQIIDDLEFLQQKIHEMYRLHVYPIIRKKEVLTSTIPMETKKKVKGPYDMLDDIVRRNDENS